MPHCRERAHTLIVRSAFCLLGLLTATVLGLMSGPPIATSTPVAAPDRIYVSFAANGLGGLAGDELRLGVRAALADYEGRLGGRKVQVVWLDNARGGRWSAKRAVANARRAANDPRTLAYIGDGHSGATALTMPILNRAGITHVTPVETAYALNAAANRARLQPTGKPTRFGAMGDDRRQGAALATLVAREGLKRVAVIDDGEVYGVGLADAVEAAARARSVRVTRFTLAGVNRAQEMRLVERIARTKAGGVVVAASPSTGGLRMMRAVGHRMPRAVLFSGEALADDAVARRLGALQPRMRLTAPAAHVDVRRTNARGLGAHPSTFAVFAYNGTTALAEAATRARRHGPLTRESLREAVFNQPWVSVGLSGPWTIAADGSAVYGVYDALRMADGHVMTPGMIAAANHHRRTRVAAKRPPVGSSSMNTAGPDPETISQLIAAGDIQIIMQMVQAERTRLLDQQLADHVKAVQARNDQIARLYGLLAGLNQVLTTFPATGGEPTDRIGDRASDADLIGIEDARRRANITLDLGFDRDEHGNPTAVSRDTSRRQLEAAAVKVRRVIDEESSRQQMDMLRLQSLSNKRNEAYSIMRGLVR